MTRTGDDRQVFLGVGNRFVVFGPDAGLPQPLRFDPEASPVLPRVPDESVGTEARLIETLQIAGYSKQELGGTRDSIGDIEFVAPSGHRIQIEVKIREREPHQRDLADAKRLIDNARKQKQELEVWFVNTERLRLTVLYEDHGRLKVERLRPLDVWEKTQEGVFERGRVIEAVEDWIARITQLYAEVQSWLSDYDDVSFETKRTVIMSEELMQKYAVPDRELPILDIVKGIDVAASFVPRGLWIVGARGRVDLITEKATSMLLSVGDTSNTHWEVVSPNDHKTRQRFDRVTLLSLVDVK